MPLHHVESIEGNLNALLDDRFLKEFSRRPPVSTKDQVRVINDFLDFIAGKMRGVDPWKSILNSGDRELGEMEFDMTLEAMEKLVMNRLWHLYFFFILVRYQNEKRI